LWNYQKTGDRILSDLPPENHLPNESLPLRVK
jgi:hypothetical protein